MRIYVKDLVARIAGLSDRADFERRHGLPDLLKTFRVPQLIPPNPGQQTLRCALIELGYRLEEDDEVEICVSDHSPCVDDEQ